MYRLRLAGLALAGAAVLAGCTAQAATRPTPDAAPPESSTPSVPPPTTTTTTTTPPPPPCGPEVRACVRLSTKEAWLMTGGVADYGPVPISHGSTEDPTPTGIFPVSWKDAEHTSSSYGLPMPSSVFFAPGGIAFHGGPLNEASHGCVHLSHDAAQLFFNALTPGQLVQVLP